MAVEPATVSGPLVQRAYVWQREWTPQVSRSISVHASAFDGLALLAAQVEWRGTPVVIRPAIEWATLRATAKPVGLVVRVHRAGKTSETAETVAHIFQERLGEARLAGVAISEFQIDYDCPQKALDAYRTWLTVVRQALASTGIPLRITSLPSWLDESAFAALADAADGYILQVHSFDLTRAGKSPTVCDVEEAFSWIAKATRLGRPFFVALPTYRCVVGYAPDGRSLGMVADGSSPTWPPGTNVLELHSDADAIAGLVASLTQRRPAAMRGLYWYRLPIEGESHNWRWLTLSAVMSGRVPVSRWEVVVTGGNPADFSLRNAGEKDEPQPRQIRITWSGSNRVAVANALGSWDCASGPSQVDFLATPREAVARIAPGNSVPLGWIRYRETPVSDSSYSYEIVR
ncbi:MAG TPA: DUF3142 domain-containing protein [Luteolibacter sp.]